MSLKEYNKKRNFTSSNEPKGKVYNESSGRFVIQYHEARAKHYDFRLEYNGVLISFAVPKGLSTNPKDKRLAVHVEDHPVDYIDFEGIIPKGNYGAGTVEIYDSGSYLEITSFKQGLKKGHLNFFLNGNKLKGAWSLVKIKDENWIIVKTDDEFVVNSSKSSNESHLPFSYCKPQLATLSTIIPSGKDWLFEIKYDGYRIMAYVENGKVKMLSRNGNDYTVKLEQIATSLKNIDKTNFIVDGEVVVFDKNGKSDFNLLQNSIKNEKNNFCYVIFDLLALDGEDLRSLPLITRKKKLERLLFKSSQSLIYSAHVEKGKECFEFAKEHNLEGIIAKKQNSIYISERNDNWLKIKCYHRQEFVIAGYTTSEKNKIISALILGVYKENEFVYVGKVGTGFSETDKKDLLKKFKPLEDRSCPFTHPVKINNVVWLKPNLIAEIQYSELTRGELLRQPSFIGLRHDKNPKEVKLEAK